MTSPNPIFAKKTLTSHIPHPPLRQFLLKPGFTLLEVMIVVASIGILSVIIFNFLPSMSKSKDAKRKSDLAQLKRVLEDYYNDNGCYPPQADLDCIANRDGLRPYLAQIPCDPQGINYLYEVDPGYNQVASDCPNWFRIYTPLENTSDPDIAKIGCTAGCGPPSAPNYTYGVSSDNIQLEGAQGSGPAAEDCLAQSLWWACLNPEDPNTGCQQVPNDFNCGAYPGGCFCDGATCNAQTGCE